MRPLGLFFASMFSMLAFTLPAQAAPVCGNSVVESGEDCDDGNTDPGDCCSPTCQYESAATVCRHAAGVCDAPDNCDGAGACTVDTKLTSECRAAAGVCDSEEVCDGVSDDCPPDLFLPPVTECRAAASVCDAAEFCDGVSHACPPDLFLPAGTECRAAAHVCDPAWFCDGVSPDCDPIYDPPPIVCRASTGVCDPEEVCEGFPPACPPDIPVPPGTICRYSSGICDIAEVCGEFPVCPADAYEPPTTVCRAAASVCDAEEFCDGVSFDCPADASITECIDDDGCCPDGCSAADDNDCLAVPALSLRGLALCFLILAVGGIVLLRQGGASRSAKAMTLAVMIAFALSALVGDSAYRAQDAPGMGSCLATLQPGAKAKSG
jgi:cysteine-rich repeat protein